MIHYNIIARDSSQTRGSVVRWRLISVYLLELLLRPVQLAPIRVIRWQRAVDVYSSRLVDQTRHKTKVTEIAATIRWELAVKTKHVDRPRAILL